MFTGIIQSVGHISALETKGGDLVVHIDTGKLAMADVELGDSIAVSGVCLTVIAKTGNSFRADVSAETMSRSMLATSKVGDVVNLEKALTPSTRLGGHLVSGHVDGIGEVVERHNDARSVRFHIKAPDELAKYIAEKGSITVDGISLTVNAVKGAVFELNIVPHTLNETSMNTLKPGSRVNIEVDLIARYLERLLLGDMAANPQQGNISEAFLAEHGFSKA
jgi:riboflavin synthase